MSECFQERRIPHLFYSADNLSCVAGHRRIFGDRPGKGWMVYLYNQTTPAWAMHRRWNFALFCIHHVGPGKSPDREGWHVTWATLKLKRSYGSIALEWRKADTFRTYKVTP